MRAIQTEVLRQTEKHGIRIRVWAKDLPCIYIDWNYDIKEENNELFAAHQFANKYDWQGYWTCGTLTEDIKVWVCNSCLDEDRFCNIKGD
jgi:hypothetical protein